MHPPYRKVALLTSILIFCILSQVFPQQVKWGKVQTSASPLYMPHIMGDDTDYIYSTSTVEEKVYIEKFKKEGLSREYSKLIDHPKIGKKELEYEGIYLLQNRFVIFASYYNNKEDNTNIYAYIYNADDGKKAGEPKIILTVPVEKSKRKGNFYVFVSKDRTKILVNHAGYYRKEKCWKDKYLLLNENLENITEREDKVFKDEIDFSTFNYIIDNDGSFYYIKKMLNGESFIVSYDANKDYEKWEEHIDFSDINRKTKIVNIRFTLNSQNDLMLVGYYTLDNKYFDGTFVMKIKTASKEIVFKKINTFDKETLRELVASNALKVFVKNNPRVAIDYYNNTEILAKKDGGIILIGENIINYNNLSFALLDIVILNHSPEGELLWAKKVPRNQAYTARSNFKSEELARKHIEYLSYFPVIQNDKINIYLNDRRSYASKTKKEMLDAGHIKCCMIKRMHKTTPVCYSFDLKSGEINKTVMLTKASEKVYFKPVISYQNKYDRDAVFFSQYKEHYKLGLLKE